MSMRPGGFFRTYFWNICLIFPVRVLIIAGRIYKKMYIGTVLCRQRTRTEEIRMANGRITRKQQQILDFIKQEILSKGYPPAVREICEAVDLKSTSSVHSHLETLEKNGYIRREIYSSIASACSKITSMQIVIITESHFFIFLSRPPQ